jgi:hypothetical protein
MDKEKMDGQNTGFGISLSKKLLPAAHLSYNPDKPGYRDCFAIHF